MGDIRSRGWFAFLFVVVMMGVNKNICMKYTITSTVGTYCGETSIYMGSFILFMICMFDKDLGEMLKGFLKNLSRQEEISAVVSSEIDCSGKLLMWIHFRTEDTWYDELPLYMVDGALTYTTGGVGMVMSILHLHDISLVFRGDFMGSLREVEHRLKERKVA